MTNKRYTLNIGCIDRSQPVTSRDSEARKFDTYAEAIESIEYSASFWLQIGYDVWFADILRDGEKIATWPNITREEPK